MVTLAEAKLHLRLDDVPEFDATVTGMIDAANDHLQSIDVDMSADPLPSALHHAVLMLVAHFFENVEATTAEQLRFTPIGVDRLIAPYKGVSL